MDYIDSFEEKRETIQEVIDRYSNPKFRKELNILINKYPSDFVNFEGKRIYKKLMEKQEFFEKQLHSMKKKPLFSPIF